MAERTCLLRHQETAPPSIFGIAVYKRCEVKLQHCLGFEFGLATAASATRSSDVGSRTKEDKGILSHFSHLTLSPLCVSPLYLRLSHCVCQNSV